MLGKIEGGRRRGRQRMRWLDGITYSMDMSLGVGDGQGGLACCSPGGCKESNTTERLNWTELNEIYRTRIRKKKKRGACINYSKVYFWPKISLFICWHVWDKVREKKIEDESLRLPISKNKVIFSKIRNGVTDFSKCVFLITACLTN